MKNRPRLPYQGQISKDVFHFMIICFPLFILRAKYVVFILTRLCIATFVLSVFFYKLNLTCASKPARWQLSGFSVTFLFKNCQKTIHIVGRKQNLDAIAKKHTSIDKKEKKTCFAIVYRVCLKGLKDVVHSSLQCSMRAVFWT